MILEQIKVNESLITLGDQCFEEALHATPLSGYSSCFVISQEKIWGLHGEKIMSALRAHGADPVVKMAPDGEETKNLSIFGHLLSWLADRKADRKSLIFVLGGGVVGDLSGFVASAYMRGVDWMYAPTTLLAQQDASIGGKVAVNLPQGKNLVGHFWNPRAVMIDSSVLGTLPQREINAGYMELLKHGVLKSESLYQRIVDLPESPDWAAVMPLLAEGLKVKVEIVREDPFEKNKRRLLNLGHTLAHAIESFTGYGEFLHGEAVGLGMIYAAALSGELGGDYDWSGLLASVKARLPRFDTGHWDRGRLLDLTQLDKKGEKGVVSWIVPYAPGNVEIVKGVDRAVLEKAFDEFLPRIVA